MALIRNWKVVGGLALALAILWLWGPWRGDDTPAPAPQTAVAADIPTLTTPPATARVDAPPVAIGEGSATTDTPAAGGDGGIDITQDDRCRWLLAPDDYLLDLEGLATEVADINQLWDNREINYRATVEMMEDWMGRVEGRLREYPPTIEGGMDDIREWAARMGGASEEILQWLRSSQSGSADKRRFAVARFDSLVRETPYTIVGC